MILRGPRVRKIAEVYEVWDSRGQVRLRLSDEEHDAVADVFSYYEVSRIKEPNKPTEPNAFGVPPVPVAGVADRRSAQKGYTLIELLAVGFIVAFVAAVHEAVRAKLGPGPALVASALAVFLGALLVIAFYRWTWSRDKRRLNQLRENYRSIYRVKELPTETKSIIKPAGAEIQIGDYGWDARPSRRDGLIHLQGLTVRWQVVWHAGFHPDQIERVAVKNASQYDYWAPYWAKPPPPPPCPYPVRERSTPTLGLPHHSGHYFENYPSQNYQAAIDVAKAA